MKIIRDMTAHSRGSCVPGECAKCKRAVYESLWVLDDAYAAWWGKCPHCGALNTLDTDRSGRGYHSQQMYLCLPHHEEVILHGLPADTPTRGWHRAENEGKSKDELIVIYG